MNEKKGSSKVLKVFLKKFKKRFPNIYALYITTGIIFIWSGVWELTEDLVFPQYPIFQHLLLFGVGFLMLYIDDFQLGELFDMSSDADKEKKEDKEEKPLEEMSFRERFFYKLENNHPRLYHIYFAIGTILMWHGMWGLTDDFIFPSNTEERAIIIIPIGLLIIYFTDTHDSVA